MHPFDPDYIGQLATEAMTPTGRQAARASRAAAVRIAAMRMSDDPRLRVLGAGLVGGVGQPTDLAKTGRILKPGKL
ncbi:hypothetical protein ACQ86G_18610 [Roseateles chitinivorans]|uniref:hypothetical protein n=1 Tax=Roseateles chitinivorans TaxID=2917965 RepID=UPI003D66B7DD